MLDTAARLLQLLSLLQVRRDWSGPDLAERLGVSTRTVRNDVERLRSLGYPVNATLGASGGYRLGSGAALPPLLLDDEEAVAVALGLRTAAAGAVAGIEETSVRALTKLEQVLPARLRHRVRALSAFIVGVPGTGPAVDPAVLTTIAGACRDLERLRFDYGTHDGVASRRDVEPHRLVHARGRWYLVGWDVSRGDWRTFRVDRITPLVPNGPRFTARELPGGGDLAAYVTRGLGEAVWRRRGRILLHAPAAQVTAKMPWGSVEPLGEDRCVAEVGSETFAMLAHYVGLLDVDFEVLEPPELAEHVRRLAARYGRAAPQALPPPAPAP